MNNNKYSLGELWTVGPYNIVVTSHPTSWEGGQVGYKAHPRLGGDLTPVEEEVRERLGLLGISEETLRQETLLGVRSPVIATYRSEYW